MKRIQCYTDYPIYHVGASHKKVDHSFIANHHVRLTFSSVTCRGINQNCIRFSGLNVCSFVTQLMRKPGCSHPLCPPLPPVKYDPFIYCPFFIVSIVKSYVIISSPLEHRHPANLDQLILVTLPHAI